MPGYVSHTVMAKNVYDKLDNKKVNLEYLLTFSLGGDLCKYAKCRYASHHQDQDRFIYAIANYIKNNNLTTDAEYLAFLYAHICHYIMDDTIHPLIRKVDKVCKHNKHNHSLIEEYYDKFLPNKIFNLDLKTYLKKDILNAKINKKIKKIIDYTYFEVYQTKKVSLYYKFNLFLYRMLRKTFLIFKLSFIERISGLTKFLENNKNIDLLNNNHLIKYKNYLKKDTSDSLIEVYEESIKRTINYINEVNKYLGI